MCGRASLRTAFYSVSIYLQEQNNQNFFESVKIVPDLDFFIKNYVHPLKANHSPLALSGEKLMAVQ